MSFKQFPDYIISFASSLLIESPQVQGLQKEGQRVYPKVEHLPASKKLRILVTGGAGFVGSHLVDRLMHQVRS
jgi:hypothetical protein